MFLPNRYYRIYSAICERAKCRQLDGYIERHHILPKSLGGDKSAENLVRLTGREHFIAHACLVRCTTGQDHIKMVYALHYMQSGYGTQRAERGRWTTGRVYEANKREMAGLVSARMKVQMVGNTLNLGLKRGHYSEEHRRNIAAGLAGLKHTDEHKRNQSKGMLGVKKSPRTAAHNLHQREAQLGIEKPAIVESNRRRVGMKYKPRQKQNAVEV